MLFIDPLRFALSWRQFYMPERKILLHGAHEVPEPYKGWIAQRNIKVGKAILEHVSGQSGDTALETDRGFLIATRTMTNRELRDSDVGDSFYGTAVEELPFVNKSILHKPVDASVVEPPLFYKAVAGLAAQAQRYKLVLPGVTVFGHDLMAGFKTLDGSHAVRFKLPGQSDGNGQCKLTCAADVEHLLEAFDGQPFQEGVVLETQIKQPTIISAGFAKAGTDTFSFIAYQKDEEIPEYDTVLKRNIKRTRYLGADVAVIKGDMEQLLNIDCMAPQTQEAVATSLHFWREYALVVNPRAHRMSFDYMYGQAERKDGRPGEFIAGITDITARPGGTDPAIAEAIKCFKNNPFAKIIKANVRLHYPPCDVTGHGETYVLDPAGKLVITAKVNGFSGEFNLGGVKAV